MKLILSIGREVEGLTAEKIVARVDRERNLVREMTTILECVKPIREPKKELQRPPSIELRLVGS